METKLIKKTKGHLRNSSEELTKYLILKKQKNQSKNLPKDLINGDRTFTM